MVRENSPNEVAIGTWVKVLEKCSGELEVYHIAENRDTDYLENKISPDNPVGRALLGTRAGQEISIDGPNGAVTLSVLEVGCR